MAGPQRAAFQALDKVSTDNPKEGRARVINQLWAEHRTGLDPKFIESNWGAVKQTIAKEEFGLDAKEDMPDTALYGAIGKQYEPVKEGDFWGKAKAFAVAASTPGMIHGSNAGLHAWDEALGKIPDAPVDELPNVMIPVPGVPPITLKEAGYAWNLLKPQIEGMASPEGVASLVAFGGVGKMAESSVAAANTLKVMSGVFTVVMAKAAKDGAENIAKIRADPNHTTMDIAKAYASEAGAVIGALVGAVGTVHGIAPEAVKAVEGKPISEAPAAIVEEAGKIEDPEKRQAMVEAANKIAEVAEVPKVEVKPETQAAEATPVQKAEEAPQAQKTAEPAPKEPEPSKPKPGGKPAEPAKPGETTGIAQRITNIEAGEGIGPEASVEKGRELLKGGADPQGALDRFQKTGAIKADDVALARAQEEKLAKAASVAGEKHGYDSEQYKEAAKADQQWREAIKPMQTEWSRIGSAQQGETALDTGDFHSIRREFQKTAGRDFTPAEAGKAQEIAKANTEAKAQADAAKAKVLNEVTEQAPDKAEKAARKTVSKALESLAESALNRIKSRQGRVMSGLDPEDLADHVIYGAAKLAKGTVDFAAWSGQMVKDLGEYVKPHLKEIWEQASAKVKEQVDAIVERSNKGMSPEAKIEMRKAALTARIKELQEKVDAGDLSVKGTKLGRPSIEEIETLEQQRDSLQEQLSGMREHASDIKDLEEQIAEKERKIKEGDLASQTPSKVNRPSTADIETLKQQRDKLTRELAKARAEANKPSDAEVIQKKVDAINKQIEEKKKAIASGLTQAKAQAANRPQVEAIENALQEREKLSDQLAEARKPSPEKRQLSKLEREIEKVQKQINDEAPFSKAPKPKGAPLSPAVAALEKKLSTLKEERQNLRDRLQPKGPKEPLHGSPEDIWKRAKEYIEGGYDDFDDIRHKIAVDTGKPVSEVTAILAGPKRMKVITNDMYQKMSKQRGLVRDANDWLKKTAMPGWEKAVTGIPGIFFRAKVRFHGTVGMITHSGINMFNPADWANYWPQFVKQFKMMGWHDGGAYHEAAMQDLARDPNYVTARRAGLANDASRGKDDYETAFRADSKLFKAIDAWGSRGFDTLKTYRQARFNQAWDAAPDSLKASKEYAGMLADSINHSTGYIKASPPKILTSFLFAPKLEGSRWAFAIGDPVKAAKTFANWGKATEAEKSIAIREVKEKAMIAGTYASLLAANEGMLAAAGSKQKINWDDPKKSDFMAFKADGYNIGIISPMMGSMRFIYNLFHASMEHRSKAESRDTRFEEMSALAGKYARGKLSPFGSFAADVATQADYQNRPMPFSSDKVPSYLKKEGIGKYTYPELILEQIAPIPVEEAIKEVWNDQGMSDQRVKHILGAIATAVVMGSTGARMSPDTSMVDKQKAPSAKKPFEAPQLPAGDIAPHDPYK